MHKLYHCRFAVCLLSCSPDVCSPAPLLPCRLLPCSPAPLPTGRTN
ncbi:MAG: hypothetical protein LBL80_01900 [Ruminococcus sp.]|nr:hypothetical protein [Ruminococcus sp.]